MLKQVDPKIKELYAKMVDEGFEATFKGEPPELKVWLPYYDLICEDIKQKWLEHPGKNMIVSLSLFPKKLRAHIATKLPFKFIVFNDVHKGSANRKFNQVKAAAEASNQPLAIFLKNVGVAYDGENVEDWLEKRLKSYQTGLDPAQPGEIEILIEKETSANDVFEEFCQKLNIC